MYDALVSIDVPAEKARAVVDALERDMGASLATRTDILMIKQEIELLRTSMTVRLGSIQVVMAGLLFAALKLT